MSFLGGVAPNDPWIWEGWTTFSDNQGDCPAGSITDTEYPDFCSNVTIRQADGSEVDTRKESDCIDETICVSGAIPGRSELFLRIIGPRPNGFPES